MLESWSSKKKEFAFSKIKSCMFFAKRKTVFVFKLMLF